MSFYNVANIVSLEASVKGTNFAPIDKKQGKCECRQPENCTEVKNVPDVPFSTVDIIIPSKDEDDDRIPYHVWPKKEPKCLLLFVKIPKCASSTMAGIARRIASELNKDGKKNYESVRQKVSTTKMPTKCRVMANHFPVPRNLAWLNRWKHKTFKWSFIRQPLERALSYYYNIHVNRYGYGTSEKKIIKYLSEFGNPRNKKSSYQTSWLGATLLLGIEEFLRTYDFIGVVERANESLVALKLIMGLEFRHILRVGDSKNTHDKIFVEKKAVVIADKTENVTKIITKTYHKKDLIDMMLWKSVNKSLDKTIEHIGQTVFYTELAIYEKLLGAVKTYCKGKVKWPYDVPFNVKHGLIPQNKNETPADTTNGQSDNQMEASTDDCYWKDNGCGIKCMDEFVHTDTYNQIVTETNRR